MSPNMFGLLLTGFPLPFSLCDLLGHLFIAGALRLGWKGITSAAVAVAMLMFQVSCSQGSRMVSMFSIRVHWLPLSVAGNLCLTV